MQPPQEGGTPILPQHDGIPQAVAHVTTIPAVQRFMLDSPECLPQLPPAPIGQPPAAMTHQPAGDDPRPDEQQLRQQQPGGAEDDDTPEAEDEGGVSGNTACGACTPSLQSLAQSNRSPCRCES